ncbi:SWI/SNF and RSC complex subunit Ssr4 [Cichlidogyrus casuarinus]|uniref:Translocon-associated protein subunit delta n=1 Tax=Cichlidogyrus casuarinus TaxID=1844966 RepID=A0ABD2QKN5_9PLAT
MLGSELQPAARDLESDDFQVTFLADHNTYPAGYYVIKFFNEDGYLKIKKAISESQDVSSISPVFTEYIQHNGIWYAPKVHTETFAIIISVFIGIWAIITKNKLVSSTK